MCTGMEPRTSITPYHVNRQWVTFADLDDVGCMPAMRYTTAAEGPGVYAGWIPQPGTVSVLPLASHPPYLEPAWRGGALRHINRQRMTIAVTLDKIEDE